MTLIIIHLIILTVTLEGISKAAAVLSVLMKVCSIPCHDKSYINVIVRVGGT